ncbi:SusC/RagA family TonB-linked outer membrane protein [Pedobacter sp. JY14-1]|uniref:SusC/RagA family TonB-linked outer membrane protein n=1 Tax=Pedobacter sp. JY14-1 TaxID=3034151 RepID=UPI0023E0D0B6|nr:SusC/RagA family TonB-linked outer membrane protein [Pedobacter sp. JY14-1]
MKQIYFRCLGVMLFTLMAVTAYAQKTVTGTVTEKAGQPIPGVSVTEKGTRNGTSTDASGKFSLSVKPGSVLTFTSIGLAAKEVTVGESSTINVTLEDDANQLGEVVVTALGIKREKKSLGYAVQEVKGETLSEAREPNLVNALSGKVAGLQITRSSNGPAGSSRITLRGNNSLTGDNQPLIVVDGVPISNFTGAINTTNGQLNNDYYNPATDMGNGLGDINPDDIESVSILKGPSAAALYGSRAGNGVIMITTKSGKAQKGLGITISSTVGLERIFTTPKTQDLFGQGTNGAFEKTSSLSWGPKAEGQVLESWDGQQLGLRTYDNIGNYAEQGITSNQSVNFQQMLGKTSVYTSYNRLDDKSIIPGTSLHRNNLMARAITTFGKDDRWTTDTKIQFNNSLAENRPNNGANINNVFATLYSLPRSVDITQLKNTTDADGKMIWYQPTGNTYNPYWAKDNNLNSDVRNRYIMTGSLKYKFNSWLDAEVKGGVDNYTTTVEGKLYSGGRATPNGSYSLSKQTFTETNFSALLSGRKDNLIDKLGGAFSLGGNLMNQKNNILGANSGELVVPDLFLLNNGKNNPTVSQVSANKKINSVYGTLQINWDGYLFLDGTLRNDWSSALAAGNRSYLYPSVSASYVFSEMLTRMGKTLPSWFTYGKVRASFATVGNDMDPYRLYNTYQIGKDPNGNTTAGRNDILFNPDVVNELIKNYEVGAEFRFLNSRLGLDVSLYKSNATNQLIEISLDPLSGYKRKIINAGNIQNKGIELVLDADILRNENAFGWHASANFSRNNNTLEYLTDDLDIYPLGGFDDVQVNAKVGQRYGEIYGTTFQRVPSGEHAGQILLNSDGLPMVSSDRSRLGNQQANALAGITNTFTYKGFNLSFLVDGRFGGKIFSGTLASMQSDGTSSKTVVNGARDNFVVDGYILNTTTGAYEKNTTAVSPQRYWQTVAGANNQGITEANLYDATNIRLRNVNLSYNLSPKFLARTPIQRAKIGVSCNNVWLITSHMNGLDPESVYAVGGNATGFENSSAPTTRTFLFNLTLGF